MQIHGLNKTTLLDYPEHVAATIFTGGCNFCCPFCHNKDLVLNPSAVPLIAEEEVLAFLKKRIGILSGVCITGGEPTTQKDLPEFIRKIKDLGYLVKLDTNGSRPKVLKSLLEEGLLDYVAMDVKNSPEKYGMTIGKMVGTAGREDDSGIKDDTGIKDSCTDMVSESIRLIIESGVAHEFRTTVVRELHKEEDIARIAEWIKGADAYFLQAYRDNENVIRKGFSAYGKAEMEKMAEIAGKYVSRVEIRGLE